MSYYNTTNLTGEQLKQAVLAAKSQDTAILAIYLNTRRSFSPWQIHTLLLKSGRRQPVTSVRRSITNLTKTNDLIMLPEQIIGEYDRPEHKWIINPAKHPTKTAEQTKLF